MGSKRAAVVAPDKYKRRKVFACRDFPKGCGRPGKQPSDLSDPEEAPLVEKEPFADPMEPSKPNNVDRVEKEEEAGLLKVSAVRRFPRGLGKPDEEISELSEPEEEVEAQNLEEKDPFLDLMESSELENMEDEMKSEDVSKGSTDGLGFSDAEKRFLSERYNLGKWRWVSAVRDFPTGCGTNSTKLRLKQAVAKKPQFRKPVGCMPSKKIESELKGNSGEQTQSRVQEACQDTGVKSPSKGSLSERKVAGGSNSERRSKAHKTSHLTRMQDLNAEVKWSEKAMGSLRQRKD